MDKTAVSKIDTAIERLHEARTELTTRAESRGVCYNHGCASERNDECHDDASHFDPARCTSRVAVKPGPWPVDAAGRKLHASRACYRSSCPHQRSDVCYAEGGVRDIADCHERLLRAMPNAVPGCLGYGRCVSLAKREHQPCCNCANYEPDDEPAQAAPVALEKSAERIVYLDNPRLTAEVEQLRAENFRLTDPEREKEIKRLKAIIVEAAVIIEDLNALPSERIAADNWLARNGGAL